MMSRSVSVAWKNLSRVWSATQLTTYGGKYSVERMLALDEYIGRTPLWRVLFVILVTPIPMALVVISQESVPLQDPAEGWRANYGFWVRVAVFNMVSAFVLAVHVGKMIDGAALSTRQLVIFCTSVAVLSTAADMGIAACWVFPVPFLTISHSVVAVLIMLIVFHVILGYRVLREVSRHREQILEVNNLLTLNVLMAAVYPAFQTVFEAALDTKWEQLAILLLPFLKLLLKNVYRRVLTDKDDFMPQGITFSVVFFDALYLATCMQRVTSIKTVALSMAADVIETAFELRELHKRTNVILDRLRSSTGGDQANLLGVIRSLCIRLEKSSGTWAHSGIQLRSCIRSHTISFDSTLLLERLSNLPKTINASPTAMLLPSTNQKWLKALSLRINEVQPITAVKPVLEKNKSSGKRQTTNSIRESVGLLRESLEVLFTAECLVLAEYVETVIPIFYANFMLVMVHLPSAKYHREMEGLTPANVGNTVDTVFLYGSLELLSFVMLAIIMHRNCGIRSLYHLAFVLETQTALIQSSLLIWAAITLTYRVIHFGADFSFRFVWIN